jgi:low temperature requirement protein LtrA
MSDDAEERHATNLELFLDLVFVFAVTQIASLLSHDLTIRGAARALLIAWLVWWQWSQFTWAGSAVDLQQRSVTRVLVL